jgi:hypothetical protein
MAVVTIILLIYLSDSSNTTPNFGKPIILLAMRFHAVFFFFAWLILQP